MLGSDTARNMGGELIIFLYLVITINWTKHEHFRSNASDIISMEQLRI